MASQESSPSQPNLLKRTWNAFSATMQRIAQTAGKQISPLNYQWVWGDIDKLVANPNSHQSSPLDTSKKARELGVKQRRGLRLIVVDGGGSLGVVPATILVEIEREVARIQMEIVNQRVQSSTEPKWKDARERNAEFDNHVFLADHVDLFCGTSAGGMISLAHAHGRLKIRAIQELFISGAAFATYYPRVPYAMAYPVARLEKAMNCVYAKLVDESTSETLQLDRGTIGRETRAHARAHPDVETRLISVRPFVFAVSNQFGTPYAVLFANYQNKEYTRFATLHQTVPQLRGDVSPTDATRATSAAPYFYPSKWLPTSNEDKSGNFIEYVDGGVANNSPVDIAVTQAQMLFGPRRPIQMVVSIGCGVSADTSLSLFQRFKRWARPTLFTLVESRLVDSTSGFDRAKQTLSTDPRFNHMVHNGLFRLNPVLKTKMNAGLDCSDAAILADIADEVAHQCQPGGQLFNDIHEIARVLADTTAVDDTVPCPSNETSFQKLRHRAEQAIRLCPPPIRGEDPIWKLKPIEWKRYYHSDGNDALADPDSNFIHLVNFLDICSTTEMPPAQWVQAMNAKGNTLAQTVEDARSQMNRCFIKEMGKSIGKPHTITDEQCREVIEAFTGKEILRILAVQLAYDQSNSMEVLQYNRRTGCKGKFWGTMLQWKEFKVVFQDIICTDDNFTCDWGNERPTISQNLELFMKVLDYAVDQNDAMKFFDGQDIQEVQRVRGLFSFGIPVWILEKYPQQTETLKDRLKALAQAK